MIDYEREMLARGIDFRAELAARNPQHPDLARMDADIADRRVKIAELVLPPLIAEYRKGARTPELFTAYYENKLVGIEIPPCNWTEEQIRRPMVDIHGQKLEGIMVPSFPQINLLSLGQRFPAMRSRAVTEQGLITDTHDTIGWVKVPSFIDSPNRNASQSDIKKFAGDQSYLGGRGRNYVLGGQANKDFCGKYFDERATWTFWLGSRFFGEVPRALFHSDGSLVVFWDLAPKIPFQYSGWFLEEVKRV